MSYDEAHLDELCAFVLEHIGSREGWSTALQHVDPSASLEMQIKPVAMSSLIGADRDSAGGRGDMRPFRIFRMEVDVPNVDSGFAIRRLIARSRFKEYNEFIVSEELVAELRGPDPRDADGLGLVHVYADRHNYFGWRLQSLMAFAPRRLPDGSGLMLKVPADCRDGVWTTRGHLTKARSLVGWWIRPAPGGEGCRISFMQLERPQTLYTFLPDAMWVQILGRILCKTNLRAIRILLSEHAAARGGQAPALRLPFASGSASAPHRFGLAAGLEGVPPLPHVVHAFGPPPPLTAPAPKANELFYDFVGIKKDEADEAGVPPAPAAAHAIGLDVPAVTAPRVLSRTGVAVRASLDLALRFESMSLGEGTSLPAGGGAPGDLQGGTRLERAESAPPGRPKPNARQWSERDTEQDPGRALFTFEVLNSVLQAHPELDPAGIDAKLEEMWTALPPERAEGYAAAARAAKDPKRRQGVSTPRALAPRIAPAVSSTPSAPLDLSDLPPRIRRRRDRDRPKKQQPPLAPSAPPPILPAAPVVLVPLPFVFAPPPAAALVPVDVPLASSFAPAAGIPSSRPDPRRL